MKAGNLDNAISVPVESSNLFEAELLPPTPPLPIFSRSLTIYCFDGHMRDSINFCELFISWLRVCKHSMEK